jgi:hypothetical protein
MIGSYVFAVAFQTITAPIDYSKVLNYWLTVISALPMFYSLCFTNASHFAHKRSLPTIITLLLAICIAINLYSQYAHFRVRWCPYMSFQPEPEACANMPLVMERVGQYIYALF